MYFFSPLGFVIPKMSICSANHPSSLAITLAIRRAKHFFPKRAFPKEKSQKTNEENGTSISTSKGPDFSSLRIVNYVFFWIAWPWNIFLS